MPSDQTQDACVNLCTGVALNLDTIIDLTGVCDYTAIGFTIQSVDSTSCKIDGVEFLAIDDDTVMVSIRTEVDFSFTGVRTDGTTFKDSTFCESVIDSLIDDTTGVPFFQPAQCSAHLTCSARDAGFDPGTGVQSFLVTVTGSSSCVLCDPQVVNVQRCPVS